MYSSDGSCSQISEAGRKPNTLWLNFKFRQVQMPYFCNEYMHVSWRRSVGVVITSGESEEVNIEAMTFLKTVKGIYFNVHRQETKALHS